MKLKYIGKDGKSIAGIPARDLDEDEVKAASKVLGLSLAKTEGILIERGLYKAVIEKPKAVAGEAANMEEKPISQEWEVGEKPVARTNKKEV